jgi:hypothetical protein
MADSKAERKQAYFGLRAALEQHPPGETRLAENVLGFVKRLDLWPAGYELKVCFLKSRPRLGWTRATTLVMSTFQEVLSFTNLTAKDIGKCRTDEAEPKADIRVAFRNKDGDWSTVGRLEAQEITNNPKKSREATMGLDSLGTAKRIDAELKGTVRHEILHGIGFEHEHQRPDVDCHFKPAKEIAKIIGWKVTDVKDNFDLIELERNDILTDKFDPKSIMLYQLEAKYFRNGRKSPCYIVKSNNNLSELDLKTLRVAYPKSD